MKVTNYTYDKSSNWYGESQEGCQDWTLVLVTYGRCVYWIEEKKQVLEKGQWLLIPSSIPFTGEVFQPCSTKNMSFNLIRKPYKRHSRF